MGASLIALVEEDTWRKALHRPQPERDGGFIASTDGPVEVRQIPQEDGAEKGVGRKISGALQSC
jgi:hypothetical protein